MTFKPFICRLRKVLFEFDWLALCIRTAESFITIGVVSLREDIRHSLANQPLGVGGENCRTLLVEKCELPIFIQDAAGPL